jgi:Mn-dependent DtxR family transcriptional regulator
MEDSNLVDKKAILFLKAIKEYGGSATTTQIRNFTGLSRNDVTYRFQKLKDEGLISIKKNGKTKGNRKPAKRATLTGKARREIEKGLLNTDFPDPIVSDTSNFASATDVDQLSQKVDKIETKINTTLHSAESVSSDSHSEEFNTDIEPVLSSIRSRLDELETNQGDADNEEIIEQVDHLNQEFAELEDFLSDWMSYTESYLVTIRDVIETQLDVDFSESLNEQLQQLEEE